MAKRDIILNDQGKIVFKEANDDNPATTTDLSDVSLQGPAGIASSYSITLPTAKGVGTTQYLSATTSDSETTLAFTDHEGSSLSGTNGLFHGMKGDNENDDSVQWAIALGAAHSSGQPDETVVGAPGVNDRIVLPSGQYLLSVSGTFGSTHNHWIEGSGMDATIIRQTTWAASAPLMSIEASGKFVMVKNLTLDGYGLDNILCNFSCEYIFFHNVKFINTSRAIQIGTLAKHVSITDCVFTGLKNDAATPGPIISIPGTSADFNFIFHNNHVEALAPAVAGAGLKGINVTSDSSSDNVNVSIKNNHFSEFGRTLADGAITLVDCDAPVIESNIFSNNIAVPITLTNCVAARISGNKFTGDSAKVTTTGTRHIIKINSTGLNKINNTKIIGNDIVGSATTDYAIHVSASGVEFGSRGLTIADNSIDYCICSMKIDDWQGDLNISNNTISNSHAASSGEVTVEHASAISIGDMSSADNEGTVRLVGNFFIGKTTSGGGEVYSGRAIYIRSDAGAATKNCHIQLIDNTIDGMGQSTSFVHGSVGDTAVVYIEGTASNARIATLHASGNVYDFTNSQSYAYGMYADDTIKELCTFDSVMEFGAGPEQSAHRNTMAIHRATEAAGAGGVLRFPAGTYNLSDNGTALSHATAAGGSANHYSCKINNSRQVWEGEGTLHDSLADVGGASNNDIIQIDDDVDDVVIRGLSFTCVTDDSNTGTAITTGDGTGLKVEGCTLTDFKSAIDCGGEDALISACNIVGAVENGIAILIQAGASNGIITKNHITIGAGSTLRSIDCSGNGTQIINNEITSSSTEDISLHGSKMTIRGNVIDRGGAGVAGRSIVIGTGSGIVVADNIISSTRANAATSEDIYLNVTVGVLILDCSITGNIISSKQVFIGANGAGIVQQLVISGNSFSQVAGGVDSRHGLAFDAVVGPNQCIISNNIIKAAAAGATTIGINLSGGQDNTVTGNHLENFVEAVGVSDAPQTDGNNIIIGNTSTGHTTFHGANADADPANIVANNSID